MIQVRLKELMAEHERQTGQRVTYDILRKETGIWPRSLSVLATNKARMVGMKTIDALCAYFDCQPGDLLLYVPEGEG